MSTLFRLVLCFERFSIELVVDIVSLLHLTITINRVLIRNSNSGKETNDLKRLEHLAIYMKIERERKHTDSPVSTSYSQKKDTRHFLGAFYMLG